MLKERIKWFIIIFCTVWSTSLPGLTVAGITLFPIRIIAFVWALISFFRFTRVHQLKIHFERADVAITVFMLYGLCVSVLSCNMTETIKAIIVYLTSVLVLYMCKNASSNDKVIQAIGEAFYLNTLIMAGVAIYESFTGNFLSMSYEHYLRSYNLLGTFRPKAAFYNVNNLTVYMLACLPICAMSATNKKLEKIWRLFIIGVTAFVIVLTNSRTGYIGLLMYLALYLYYGVYTSKHSKKIVFLIGIIVAVGVVIYFSPYILTRITQGISFGDEVRWSIWKETIRNCEKYFFIGSGIGTCTTLNGSIGPAHNFFLEILCEFGLVGLIAICALLVFTCPNKQIVKNDVNGKFFRIFTFIFLICSICPSSMQGYYFIWAIWGVSLGYIKHLSCTNCANRRELNEK